MLRPIFVLCIITVGSYYALQAPFYALLFYLWNAYFRPEVWLWDGFLQGANLSYIIGCYTILVTFLLRKKFVLNTTTVLIILFLIQTFISTLTSSYYEYSWPFWIEFLKINIIGYLMLMLVDDFSKLRMVLLVIALSLGFEGSKQGWVDLLTSPGLPNTNPLPFLGDNNGVALGMLMLVPIIGLLAQTASWKWARPAYYVLLIGVLYRAVSTYSRGGFMACIALAGIYWLQSHHKFRSLMALLILMMIIVATLPDAYWNRMNTIQTYEEEEDDSALGRFHFWQVALVMAEAHPFFGIGFNAYNKAYDTYDFLQGRYGQMRSVHNSALGIAGELGYLGLALYALILLCAFRSCSRVSKMVTSHPDLLHLQSTAIALRSGLWVYLVGGSFLAFQYNEMFWHYIFLSFALDQVAHQSTLDAIKTTSPPTSDCPSSSLSPTNMVSSGVKTM
jgi:probable O-glycosylation ligase (exosortase A-associated)